MEKMTIRHKQMKILDTLFNELVKDMLIQPKEELNKHATTRDGGVGVEQSVVSAHGTEQLCVWELSCIKELRKTFLS